MAICKADEDLALFSDMRRHEKDQRIPSLTGLEASQVAEKDLCIQRRRTAIERFLYSENETSDYDWLLAHDDIPQFAKEPLRNSTNQLKAPNVSPADLKSKLQTIQEEPAAKIHTISNLLTRASKVNSTTFGAVKKISSSSEPKSVNVPNVRATKPSRINPSRSSTPTSQAALCSAENSAPQTKSGFAKQSTSRSSTDGRPSLSASKSTSRSSVSISAGRPRSSSVKKLAPEAKYIAFKASEIFDSSPEAPLTMKVSLPERSISASRVREASGANSLSLKARTVDRPKRQSKSSDDVNPVLMGTQMVERVVNMRKLAPPKQDDHNSAGKSTLFPKGSGFGRSLSRSSLDMALRHMDIGHSISSDLRVAINKFPAGATCNDRSLGSLKDRTARNFHG